MWRQVLIAVICYLALGEALLSKQKKVNSSVTDNASAESVSRLYQNMPVGVYASAAPYGSSSFHAPSVVRGPIVASSQVNPVKSAIVPSSHGYLKDLKDSYGKFVSPSQVPYKMAYPPQYVQLQELPAHLSQPLAIAAAPSFQYKQAVPHYIFGSQPYRIPSLSQSSASPTPLTHFGRFSQPLVYAENIRGFAPSTSGFYNSVPIFPNSQKQSGISVYHSNTPTSFHSNSPASFQRLQEIPESSQNNKLNSRQPKIYEQSYKLSHASEESHSSHTPQSFSTNLNNNDNAKDTKQENSNSKGQIQAEPAQTSVTAIVNGKKTVVTLETKPPLPLLNLSLLEPLTFDNPVVPQVQNFLPRINDATYHKLPNLNVNDGKKNYNKQFTIQKTKSYDSGVVVGKPKAEAPKKKKINKKQNKPAKPTVIVSEDTNGGPEFSYEINSPNYKETYNEQVVSYNKMTNMKPVTFTYSNKNHEEPVTYSFSHSSKEPLKVQHVEYESNPENPKELIYTFSPEVEDEHSEQERQPPHPSENSEDSSAEINDDEIPSQPHRVEHHSQHRESPNHHGQYTSQGHSSEAPYPQHQSQPPRNSQRHEGPHHHKNMNHQHESTQHHHESPHHRHESPNHHHEGPSNYHGRPQSQHEGLPRQIQYYEEVPPTKQAYYHVSPPPQKQNHPSGGHHQTSPSHQLQPEHRKQVHHHLPNKQVQQEIVQLTPHFYSTPLTFTVQNAYQAITPEYEEDIRLLKPHQPNAPIRVDPSQHVQENPSRTHANASPSLAPQKTAQELQEEDFRPTSGPQDSPAPHVMEKSKGVIIKEEILEENPDEDEPSEPIEEVDNEEDFEKAYKNSAFGFPAYEENNEEKDVFDPETYGVPKFHLHYDTQNSPFQQYQEDGDEFPKSTRLNYKDARDKLKEDYFLDYAVNKPQTFADHYRKKEDYYKTYKHNRPEKLFGNEEEKPKQKEKYVLASPSFTYPSSVFKPKEKKQYFIQYKAAPKLYEFDYSKGSPQDNSPFASSSQPFRKYKTQFVEPQFHYGFSPITAPLVLDSELAAMASNHSPESEKPMRKKIYKENWYIKKTSTTAGKPS